MGVSRPVIRESIKLLQSKGYIKVRRGVKGGAIVQNLNDIMSSETLTDLIRSRKVTVDHLAQVRLFLEPEIVRLAVQNATTEDLERIENLLKEYDKTTDLDKRVSLNARFHKLIGKSCGNPIYAWLLESIMNFTEKFVRTIKPLDRILHNDMDHKKIFNALKARNKELTTRLIKEHAESVLNEMKKLENVYLMLVKK